VASSKYGVEKCSTAKEMHFRGPGAVNASSTYQDTIHTHHTTHSTPQTPRPIPRGAASSRKAMPLDLVDTSSTIKEGLPRVHLLLETVVSKGMHPTSPLLLLSIPRLLLCVNMPYNVVWKTVDTVAGALGHLCEAFGFGLVFEGVAREVDTC